MAFILDEQFLLEHRKKMDIIKSIGYEILQANGESKLGLAERLSDDLFKSLLSDFCNSANAFSNCEFKFFLYIYSKYLQDCYLLEIKNLFSNSNITKYKFWLPMIYWRFNDDVKLLNQNELDLYLKKYIEYSGNFESLEWKLRVNNKFSKGVKYIKSFKSNCFNEKTQEYKFNKIFTDEFEIQKEIIIKYENIFKRIRMAKKYLTDNSKNLYYANQNLNQIYNSI